jgi:RecJ-like exonuclease
MFEELLKEGWLPDCPCCAGTGEGPADGTSCPCCAGRGYELPEVESETERFETEREEPDEWSS